MMFPPVLTKIDFSVRYKLGEFGNASPTWNNLEEFLQSGYRGLIHIRNRIAGGMTHYNIPADKVRECWNLLEDKLGWYLSAMAPTAKTVIQGEVMRTERGLYLYCSFVAKPMRDALNEKSENFYGIMASFLLTKHLCPNSYDWLIVLLDRYPGHVVEFSTYSINWGTIPHYNTVFWEVRNY